jgi:predicted ATPase/class 3 adenylate cyclase
MHDRPRGTVTFLFTDIEGSTRILSAIGPERYGELLGVHHDLMRAAIAAHAGHEIDTAGDAFFVAFEKPREAVDAVVEAQRGLAAYAWPEGAEIKVRMGIHTAEATSTSAGYVGVGVHRAARICHVAHGGQVLISQATHDLLLDEGGGAAGTATTLLDLGTHRLKDFQEPQRIFQLRAPGLATDFPPLRSAISPTNLPAELTSFVGREREAGEIRALLDRHRLVSLVGVGGTGKTRLLLHVAGEVVGKHADGEWLVELAPLREPGLVVEEAVRAVGVQVGPGQPAIGALIDFLRDKDLLLLLDNCEHLIEPAAALAEQVLGSCRSVQIIATSREALGISGEATYPVPSLGVPALSEEIDIEAIGSTEAVALFVERATTTLPSFRLDTSNAAAVVEICRRLDGIPLALELAAARVNVLSPAEIAKGLGDRFRLLTGGRRTAVPRQQTLQALIDWSWDLLHEQDQGLLRRLSVFAGGWTLEAAAAVTGGEVASPFETLDGLGRLVDRSLVTVGHEGETRYGMLETIRQYANDRLVASGEANELRARHLAWFRRFVHETATGLYSADMLVSLRRIETEFDNARAALEWAFETDPQAALEMCLDLGRYWRTRSMGLEGVDLMRRAAELARQWRAMPSEVPDAERLVLEAQVVASLQLLMWNRGVPSAGTIVDHAVEIARASGDPAALIDVLAMDLQIQFVRQAGPGLDAQRAIAHEVLDLATGLGDPFRLTLAQGMLGLVEAQADPASAEDWLARAAETARSLGNPWTTATGLQMRGRVAAQVGRLADAQRFFREAQILLEQVGDTRFALSSQSELAHALRRSGATDEAAAEYRKTIAGWQRSGNRGAVANQLESFAFLAITKGAEGDGGRAARLLGAAEALRERAGDAMSPRERIEYDAAVTQLRGLIDAPTFDAAWAEGRALTADAAVGLAAAD